MTHRAWLGRLFDSPCAGKVHSVFERVVNLAMETRGGMRLLTLIDIDMPRLPDAAAIPRHALLYVEQGMSAELNGELLTIGNREFLIERDSAWSGRISERGEPTCAGEFLDLTESLSGGLEHVPEARRKQALDALCTPEAARWIGLGIGLTPSYDDMCVGAMAVCHALGKPMPFDVTGNEDTTDISLRYLLLAREGRFGEPVCGVIDVLYGKASLDSSVDALMGVGSTSGADMLCGMRMMLKKTINKEFA